MNSAFIKKEVQVFCNTKAKIYPNGYQKITVCSKPIFKNECWEDVRFTEPIPKPQKSDNKVRSDNIKRAKERVFDISLCNDFDYFFTWTLSANKIDRYNSDIISKKLKKYLDNRVQRNNAKYILIPEQHKDGAIHFHGLLSGNFKMIDSSKKTKKGQTIFNMFDWKYGFSTAIKLDTHKDFVCKYITKYITKDVKKIFGNFYYAGGHGLIRKPKVCFYDSNYDFCIDSKEYKSPNCSHFFKYYDVSVNGEISYKKDKETIENKAFENAQKIKAELASKDLSF